MSPPSPFSFVPINFKVILMSMDVGTFWTTRHFRRRFRWEFEIMGVDIKMLCKSVQVPTLSFDEHEAKHQVETIYFPGRPKWDTIDLVLIDTDDHSASWEIENWIYQYYESRYGEASWNFGPFKKTCKLTYLDPKGSVTGTWTIEGAWPVNFSSGEMDYSSSDIVEVSASLRYDRAYYR